MSYIKFLNSDEHLNRNVKIIDDHTVEVSGCNQNLSGFQLFTDADFMFGDYSKYKYDYEEPNLGNKVYRYTNDNHKWKKPISNWKKISLQLAEIYGERFTKYLDI